MIACFARALLFSLIVCAGVHAQCVRRGHGERCANDSCDGSSARAPFISKKLEKLGGRPDYAVAPTAEFFPRSFDVALIATLSFPKADDARSLIDWVRAAHKAG